MSRARDRVKRARRVAWVLHKHLCAGDPQRATLQWTRCKRCAGTGKLPLLGAVTSRKVKGYKAVCCRDCWGEGRR